MSRSPSRYGDRPTNTTCPRICFVNKMDKVGADFYFSVKTMEERLGANVIPIQLPVGSEGDFEGVVDLVEMNAKVWRGETKLGETYDTIDIPAELRRRPTSTAPSCSRPSPRPTSRCWRSTSAARSCRSTRSRVRCASSPSVPRPTWCCAAARSRTRACSRCSTPSSTTCLRRWMFRLPWATPPARRTRRSSASRRPTSRSRRWRSRSPRTRFSAS